MFQWGDAVGAQTCGSRLAAEAMRVDTPSTLANRFLQGRGLLRGEHFLGSLLDLFLGQVLLVGR
ncbi:hypothetical protein D3C85_715680 [compost metagenome]